ncbi:HhH-GPD family protein [Parenemella sanctibonifatiensis]|uniref:Adenine DNA glycosylase n=1 Tax=Parenemella sanctibonifatiensis TaxID=2016505 RepID=A0A255DZB4_9ACTN|nr:A/G-specific adenine glycosylase [Parenemella sanctibonifatiensis]OYN84648.1 adenine glycosylase [Parenemella sanctibonifatiensis]
MDRSSTVTAIRSWFGDNARDLPWRRPEATPWQIMVSEFMLQQTPVARVLGPWQAWVDRWPVPAALAAAPTGDAIRAWGRLGYPRRALRLHAAATAITDRHDGQVPDDHDQLLALPGVGAYTAAAIHAFAFGGTAPVLDTNVRRVLLRLSSSTALPPAHITRAERDQAADWAPDHRPDQWWAAAMELGALVCTARTPDCTSCPVASACTWLAAGQPPADQPRRGQAWVGTDRQCRGALMAVLRSHDGEVYADELAAAWQDGAQRERCLASLVADGLIVVTDVGHRLP